jgi:hypothetical protein
VRSCGQLLPSQRVWARPAAGEHLRAQEICGELPRRAIAVQAFIVITAATLAERHGGVRALTGANTALGATKRLVRRLSLHLSLLSGSAILADPVRRTASDTKKSAQARVGAVFLGPLKF